MVLDGLTACGVPISEFGNAGGIGAYEVAGFTQALTDQEYLDIGKRYLGRGSELGMFLNARRYRCLLYTSRLNKSCLAGRI